MPRPRPGVPDVITDEMRLRNATVLAKAQLAANSPKNALIAIANRLERDGLMEDARRLRRVILDLEAWQNRR